ncbi:MAG: hypothetical protein B0A82_15410 [Alkalinema sp. CACIAM 70d]|nr:MAG: hypothetical protein B0A82_15410 [Alkalinema sp. CACIAM 70d]
MSITSSRYLNTFNFNQKSWLTRWIGLNTLVFFICGIIIPLTYRLVLQIEGADSPISSYEPLPPYLPGGIAIGILQVKLFRYDLPKSQRIGCIVANVLTPILFLGISSFFRMCLLFDRSPFGPSPELVFKVLTESALWAGIVAGLFYGCVTTMYQFLEHRWTWLFWSSASWALSSVFAMVVILQFSPGSLERTILYPLLFGLIHAAITGVGLFHCGLHAFQQKRAEKYQIPPTV